MSKKTAIVLIPIVLMFLPGLLFAQGGTQYLITWNPSPEPDVASYIIFRSNDLSPGQAIDSVASSVHHYIDSGVVAGQKYYYRLVAKNQEGLRSSFSDYVSGITIPQNADETQRRICNVDDIIKIGEHSYEVSWSTAGNTIGFIQYGTDGSLDSISDWDETYATDHASTLDDLDAPGTYLVRAVSYDNDNNMIISANDTIVESGEEPVAPTAPEPSIYPVPYHPGMGSLFMNNLPEGGTITVFNENGLEVWNRRIGGETSITWDGTNMRGDSVMSGIYYVLITDAGGDVVDKRSLMIVH
jgi:hypothetical protein